MNRSQISKTHSRIRAADVRPLELQRQLGDAAINELSRLGIVIEPSVVREQVKQLLGDSKTAVGDSAFTAAITSPSIPTPLQFLQTWLPGFVKIITAARKIDKLIGIKTVGSWEDQEIVQGVLEPAGAAIEYGDFTNVPLASWNVNFERRSIVRGELGIQVGLLEEGRAAAMRVNSAEEKRQGAAVSLEVMRNAIGFYGWNNGTNRTFGFLNDPNLAAAITTSTAWSGATFQQITSDIRRMVVTLRTQSQDQIDPEDVDLTLALPMTVIDYLTTTTDFGISVRDWLKQTYPRIKVESAPELQNAVGGANVAYLYAEDIPSSIDGSSDGGETFAQLVQTKFITYGVEKRAKSYVEDFGNATAGVLLKRPWAVVRMTGM